LNNEKELRLIKNTNFVTGLVFLFIAVIFYTQTFMLPSQVALFPRITLLIIGLMGILLVFDTARGKLGSKKSKIMNKDVIIAGVGLVVTYSLLKFLGFYSAVTILLLFMYLHINKTWKLDTFLKGIVFSLVSILILYLAFHLLMSLITPTGLLI